MLETDDQRRLAAILAVDMAGYSRRAESDQAAAVNAVSHLSQVIAQVASDHTGRVFNTAGDGFMLEFPTALGALEAAADLVARAPVPVRIGVHLGDVHVTPNGDLLGHGVNVAARLQAMAAPGAILVSDDLRRAARGPLAEQLKRQGAVRLDKMRETAHVWALLPAASTGRKAMRRSPRPLGWALAGGGSVLLLAAVCLWLLRPSTAGPVGLTAAVRDFKVEGQGIDPQFGVSIADSVAAGLSARDAPTISRDVVRRGDVAGARLLVGGEIARDGENLRVHAHIDDATAGLILWSADFERPTNQVDALQDTTTTKIADLVDLVRRDAAELQAVPTPEILTALLHAEDISRLTLAQDYEDKRAAWRQVIKLEPKFAYGHANLALFDVFGASSPRPELKADAETHIKTALALDPHSGDAYVAAAFLPEVSDRAAQEAWLMRGLAADPGHSQLNFMEAVLAGSMGRESEALRLHQKALETDPLSRAKTLGVVFALMGVGRVADARALNDRARRMWADYPTTQLAELTLDLIYGDQASGERALAAAERGELSLTQEDIAAWRKVLAARAGRMPAEVAARALVQAAEDDGQLDLGLEVAALSELGQADMAFVEMDRRLPLHVSFYFNNLFFPATAELRRSSKFMPFVARHGLTQYWLATGRWPDFCAAGDRPYDCMTAAKAAESR